MSEHYRAVSMAFALVDEKIGDVRATLPRPTEQIDQIDSFLDSYSDRVDPSAGGSIANVISTYSGIALGGRAKLFYSIGNDDRGKLFRSETEHLVGGPQIDSTKATGTCIFIISETGEPLDEITFYGAAESVELPKDEVSQDSYDIFVSNVNTFRVANDRSHDLLRAARRTNGIFVLRLSGAHAIMINRPDLLSALSSIKEIPEIVFANEQELEHITGSGNTAETINTTFPNARVFVLTLGSKGSLLRYEGQVTKIPPFDDKNAVVDTTGAGDSYMGVMLGTLFSLPYDAWTEEHVRECAQTGTFAASRLIRSFRSRLTDYELNQVRDFFERIQVETERT